MKPAAAAIVAAAMLAAACGKKEAPAADAAAERAQAHERARKDAFGSQVQALDAAKAMQADLDRKARENVDKIEGSAK